MEDFKKWRGWSQTTTLLAALDVDKVVTTVNMKVGAYTVAAQPSAPSRISVTVTAVGTADTMGTIIFVGTDIFDRVITETVIPVAGSTVYTTRYFKTVTSATGAGWVIDAGSGNDTLTIGVPMAAGLEVWGQNVTVICVSGNIWLNPNAIVTEANGFPLTAGQAVDLVVSGTLSVIADSSGATFKWII